MNIGVLCGGGDAPGMNAAIRSVVRQGIALDARVVGFRYGFDGLIEANLVEFSARSVGGILDQGGTLLGTGRSTRFPTPEGQQAAIDQMAALGVDSLVVIGGDGSMRGAHALAGRGVQVAGIPATIDNDIWGTEATIGFDTCLNTILDAVSKLRDTASSHDRVFVVEVMGRESGELAVNAALGGGADFVLVPEAPSQLQLAAEHIAYDHWRGKLHTIILVAEGCCRAEEVAESLKLSSQGREVRVSVLGHIQRGGHPSARDRILGARMGSAAVMSLADGASDVMVGLQADRLVRLPLPQVIERKKEFDLALLELVNTLAL